MEGQGGGTLLVENGATITGNVVSTFGTTQLGATGSAAGSVFNVGGNLIFDGAVLDIDVAASNVSDKINVGGNVTFGTNTNTLNMNSWGIGEYTMISAASIANPTGLWTIQYRGVNVAPSEAELRLVGSNLLLQTFDTVEIPIVEWDGSQNNDPSGIVWDDSTVPDDVIVLVDRPETDLITIEGTDITVAGLLIDTDVTFRTGKKSGTGTIHGKKSDDPQLSRHRANGRLVIEGGTILLDIATDFEDGTLNRSLAHSGEVGFQYMR